MVATISPAADSYEETLSTLRYADRQDSRPLRPLTVLLKSGDQWDHLLKITTVFALLLSDWLIIYRCEHHTPRPAVQWQLS